VSGAAATGYGLREHRGMITLTIMVATILPSLDNTIANVALPRMQGSLSATQEQMTWVLTSYIVAAAIMTPLAGWLADRFGRKPVFLYSVVGFTIASALCGMAISLDQVVLFRVVQGVAGASLIPMSQAVLFDVYPPEQHGRAMGIWALGVVLAPMLGPVVGGWLTDNYSWRWIFFINVPFGIIAVLGVLTYLPDTRHGRKSFDFFGFAALALLVGALQIMLDRGSVKDWFNSAEIRIYAVIVALSAYIFCVHTLSVERPFVRIALFRDRNYLSGNIMLFVTAVMIFSNMALMPTLLQNLMNYSVLQAGLMMMPRGAGTALAMFLVSRAIGRIDARLMVAVGVLLGSMSLWWMAHFALVMDMKTIFWTGAMQGFGFGIVYVPLSTMTFATLPVALRNEGTAITALIRNLGASLGIAISQGLLVHNVQVVHARLAAHITPYSETGQQLARAAGGRAAALLNAAVTAQSMMVAYIDDFYIMTLLTLLILPLLLLVRNPRRDAPAVKEVIFD